MMTNPGDERFWRRLLSASAPLFIWAGHFFACYLLVAAQCSPALIDAGMPDRPLLLALSVVALGACLALLWRSRSAPAGLYGWAQRGTALLGTIAVALTSIPVLMVSAC
ncbi:MAG: hypothetical protein JWP59_2013 [Massilia sp.]|nr:hypothetical protein [Massilia sp.]